MDTWQHHNTCGGIKIPQFAADFLCKITKNNNFNKADNLITPSVVILVKKDV